MKRLLILLAMLLALGGGVVGCATTKAAPVPQIEQPEVMLHEFSIENRTFCITVTVYIVSSVKDENGEPTTIEFTVEPGMVATYWIPEAYMCMGIKGVHNDGEELDPYYQCGILTEPLYLRVFCPICKQSEVDT